MIFLSRESKEKQIEACYNLFEEIDWNLPKFKNNTDLFVEEIRKNAREYAKNYLKESLTKEQIWCLLPSRIRLIFNNYDSIIKLMLEKNVISREQLLDIDWIIDNLKKNMCKFCYDISEEYKWINIEIDDYCNKHNIIPLSLKNMAREYTLEVLKLDENKREEHWNKKLAYRKDYNLNQAKDIGAFAKMFIQLSEIDGNEEVIKFLESIDKKSNKIKQELVKFISSYNISDDVKNNLINKVEIYHDYLVNNRKMAQEKKKEEEQDKYIKENLETARSIINEYINSQYEDIVTYCDNINLDKKMFDKYLNLIKENDEKIYNNYLEHEERVKKQQHDDLVFRALKVIDMMKNGVDQNGIKKEFDLIDYYRYLPLGFDRMLRIVRDSINIEDYKLLGSYIETVKTDRELSENEINCIYNTKTITGIQFDEEKKIIPGTGREITKEEKQNIINYLKVNNIPVTNKTYNIIYKRWLSGNLDIDEKGKKK